MKNEKRLRRLLGDEYEQRPSVRFFPPCEIREKRRPIRFKVAARKYTSNAGIYALFLLGLMIALLVAFHSAGASEPSSVISTPNRSYKTANNPVTGAIPDPCGLNAVTCPEERVDTGRWRTVTAYNTVPGQTDSTPCISADGTDICEGMARGEKYVATNELPFGAVVEIAGERYIVVDRTNSRYAYRYDIAMPADKIAEAFEWGSRVLDVQIIQQ